ncbi:hypothetical protein EFIBHEMM_02854 [Mannheimia haemolytica]
MEQLFQFLEHHTDFVILGLLGLLSVICLWKAIERIMFYSKVDISKYDTLEELDIDLTHNLTTISTIGSNAPYIGLLGTVVRYSFNFLSFRSIRW